MNNKQAIKYGVPTLETCKKLQWAYETNFYYVGKNLVTRIEKELAGDYDTKEYIPAPQIHEIMPVLPICVLQEVVGYGKKQAYYFNLIPIIDKTGVVIYENKAGRGELQNICRDYDNNHYAEAYALMYILLKNKNLLQ